MLSHDASLLEKESRLVERRNDMQRVLTEACEMLFSTDWKSLCGRCLEGDLSRELML